MVSTANLSSPQQPAPLSELVLGNLQACLNQQLALIRKFAKLLCNETQLLESHANPEALFASSKNKNACLEQLASCAHQREQLLHELSGGQQPTTSLQDIALQAPQLASLVNQLLLEAAQASELNEANGLLIQNLLKQNQDMQRFLVHKKTANNSLYNADGRPKNTIGPSTTHIEAK